MDLQGIMKTYYNDDITSTLQLCDSLYCQCIGDTMMEVYQIYDSMKKDSKITDEELQWVIISLPMELIQVSESLNDLRLSHSVIKLKQKEVREDITAKITDCYDEEALKKSGVKAEIKGIVDVEMAEHKIVESIYQTVITRIENEISFCKELIMGCKKVWDARRQTESVNPIKEVDADDLPDYVPEN